MPIVFEQYVNLLMVYMASLIGSQLSQNVDERGRNIVQAQITEPPCYFLLKLFELLVTY